MAGLKYREPIVSDYQTNEDFAALLQDTEIDSLKEGTIIQGVVRAIEKDIVVVDIGFKQDGRVNIREFGIAERDDLAPGQTVDVYLERIDNGNAETIISREAALREEAWDRLVASFEKNENVDGIMYGRVKGGFTVDLGGIVAFLPGSQVDVRPVKDPTPLMNVAQPFQILKMDKRRGNIVVSRRAIMEEARSAERAEALSNIYEGKEVTGVVKNITDYGAFIDLGALDGLLHVTDISWRRINHPTEVIEVNQEVKCIITKFDESNQRVSLGMKQLQANPWDGIGSRLNKGDKIAGTVTNVTDFGAFVQVEDNLEGLVPTNDISWTKKNTHPNKLVNQGDKVDVVITDIDMEKQRLGLSIKAAQDNPWSAFSIEHPSGSEIDGEITNITDFGIFVKLTGGDAEGLIHVNDLSWDEKPEVELKKYAKGDKVKAMVLDVDPEKEKVSLGIKQLAGDPFKEAMDGLKAGEAATVTVTKVQDNGVEVSVGETGIISFIRRSDLAKDRVECRPERFSEGDRMDAKVVAIDAKTRSVKLSIKALEQDEERRAIKEFGSADSGASLGGILGIALDSAKQEAEAKKEKEPAKKPAAKKAVAKKDEKDA